MEYQMTELRIPFRKAKPVSDPAAHYPGLRPQRIHYKAGQVARPGGKPLTCDIVMDQDVAVALRDGTRIYVDIFRPSETATDLPAIVSWGPYGKQGGVMRFDDLPLRGGIPVDSVSGLEMFEGPDPAYWCAHGYAIVNADARGVASSEGDVHCWGVQEGRDGHDLVEWVASQPWSNGKVGMSGTSWLAIVQWFVAAERPPHLAAISPCEGWTDLYRTDVVRGGIPDAAFNNLMVSKFAGPGQVEDVPHMVHTDPLMNDYWRDKIPALEKIDVPAYIISSWTNLIHAIGTFGGWKGIASQDKWLHIHNTHEWTHYYNTVDQLRAFFDHFLKGLDNGWDKTPRVQLAVLDPGKADIVDRPEETFPLARTQFKALYLDAASDEMKDTQPTVSAWAKYDPCDKTSRASFSYRFEKDTELVGYFKLRLWVSAEDADDLDIYAEVRKLDADERHLGARTFLPPGVARTDLPADPDTASGMLVFSGAKGMQRASLRATDPAKSTPSEPYHTFDRVEKLASGEVVAVDIQIWPLGMVWRAGEQIRVVIGGQKLSGAEFPGLPGPDTINRGRHVIHTGGQYDSHLLIPVTG